MQAFFGLFGPSRDERLRAMNLPAEWGRVLGPEMADYAVFLSRLKLRNIRVRQIIEPHLRSRGGVRNGIPPRSQWRNIRTTLKTADLLVSHLRVPLVAIVSAYRSPAYNAKCPGARPQSYHTKNMALDLRFACSTSRVARTARELRERGHFSGGVGRYSSFTHIDCRGSDADW